MPNQIGEVQIGNVPPISDVCETLSINVLFQTIWGSHYIGYYSFVREWWYCFHTGAEIGYNDEIAGWWYIPSAKE